MSLSVQPIANQPRLVGVGNANGTQYTSLLPKPAAAKAPAAPSGGGGGGGGGYYGGYSAPAPAPVYAPKLDVSGIYTNARNQGNADANQYYNTRLNQFIQQQTNAKALQQQQRDMEIKNYQDALAQTQEQNTTSGNRATEDTALKLQQTAQTADQRQVDQGSAFDVARSQEAQKEAQSGLAGSGLAAGSQLAAQQTHGLTEQRQAQADQQTNAATNLAKARTFEDLATSNKYAVSTEQKGEQTSNFNLSKFIQGQAENLASATDQFQTQRQQQALSASQNYAKMAYASYLQHIANPAQKVAAAQQYGGLF